MKTQEKNSGGTTTLITIAYRNIWRNLRRTILCFTAVAIAVFFNIFMQSFLGGMIDSVEKVVTVFDTGHVNVVSARFEEEKEYYPAQYPVAEGRETAELERSITAIPGVKAVLPRIMTYATLQDSVLKHALLWGLDIERELPVNDFNITRRDSGIVEGRFPSPGSNECVIGTFMAKKAGFKIGDKIPLKTVSAQFSDKMWSPEIVGLFEFDYRKYDENAIIVSFDRLARLLVLGEGTQQLFIYADNGNQSGAVARQAAALLGEESVVREWQDNYWVAGARNSTVFLLVIFLIFQIVASLLIVNTIIMVINERIKEIGMMGSLGMTRKEIVLVFFFEAVFLSLIGALAGCIVGGAVTGIGSLFPFDTAFFSGGGESDWPMSGAIFMRFSPLILIQGFFFGVAVASICTLVPSLKSAFVEPVEALRR